MSIFKSLLFKELRKSAADDTFCRSRGRNILKSKVSRNGSKTFLQQKQRRKMKALEELSRIYAPAVQCGFPTRATERTVYNEFIAVNKAAVTVDDELQVTVDYSRIACSKGIRMIPEVTVELDAEKNELTFTCEVDTLNGTDAEEDDVIHALLVEKERKQSKLCALGTRKECASKTVQIPKKWNKDNLEIYAFVLSANKRKASPTVYLTPDQQP